MLIFLLIFPRHRVERTIAQDEAEGFEKRLII
jgi:hypothetical protein